MDLGISGRRAAVAAASQGLGKATAAALAAEGVAVALCSRDRDRVEAAAADIPGAVPLVADVSTEEGAIAFVRAARDALGGVDILVANGGGPPPGNFATTETAAYRAAFEQNCLATIAMCAEVVPAMQAGHWGRVLAITSVAVRQPIPNLILSNTACGAHRIPEDPRARGRGRRRHREHPPARQPRHRAHPGAARRCARGARGHDRPTRRLRPHRGLPVLRSGALRDRSVAARGRRGLRRVAVTGPGPIGESTT